MDNGKTYKSVYDENIILMYKGELTFDLITTIISTLENRISELENDRKVKKRFYSIITECIQNLYYHMDEAISNGDEVGDYDSKAALVLITARDRFYSLVTGNYIPTNETTKIQKKIDDINAVPVDGLRDLYKKILNETEFSDKGTGGLGFIDIARKTGQKLIYKFHPVSDDYSYFTFQVKLPRSF
ncbi:MAG: SiaB family protein kinase [Cyclobacteriaceae bacterium]